MAVSTKIILRKKSNKKGEYPLAIRISKDRKVSYIYLGHYIDLKYWDSKKGVLKRSHPNYLHLKNFLETKLAEIGRTLLNLQTENRDISSAQLKNEVKASLSKKDFFALANEYLDDLLIRNKLNQLSSDRPRVNHIKLFCKKEHLPFKEINVKFLKEFMYFLRVKRKVSERSIINNLIVVRTIFNRGIKSGLVDRKFYPFGQGKIVIRFPETEKIGLNAREIKKIENIKNLNDNEEHARNIWLFSFYMAGIRASDIFQLKWKDIIDDRLNYRMGKNSKLVSLIIPKKAQLILDSYKEFKVSDNDLIFPDLRSMLENDEKLKWKKTKLAIRKTNRNINSVALKCGINKKVSMHIARHSFGNIAGNQIPIQILQQLYRHSSITTTMMYQSNFINSETDRALQKVVNF